MTRPTACLTAALLESANLLLTRGRHDGGRDWVAFSMPQRDAAVAAMKAAQRKDGALSVASDALYETCASCHKQFMQK
jgi:hypothetical protein